MKRPNEPPDDKEAPRPNLSRLEEEARRVIYEYAAALREIIKKLRQRLN
jgi:signal recognition particle subunit SEC65